MSKFSDETEGKGKRRRTRKRGESRGKGVISGKRKNNKKGGRVAKGKPHILQERIPRRRCPGAYQKEELRKVMYRESQKRNLKLLKKAVRPMFSFSNQVPSKRRRE